MTGLQNREQHEVEEQNCRSSKDSEPIRSGSPTLRKVDPAWSHMTKSAQPFRFKHKGVTVNGEIVSHGNVFVMTDLPMAKVTPDLVGALNKRGEDFARKIGHPDTLPKVFIYDVKEKSGRELQCDATLRTRGW